MDQKRMDEFLKNVRKQRKEEYCNRGHFYENTSGNSCVNCGISMEKMLGKEVDA